MNVVDTSGWLEYFTEGKNAQVFAKPLSQPDELVVPTVCIYEISKVILRERDENHLLQALAVIQKGTTVELTPSLALSAAKASLQYKLPMADSIVFATAQHFKATLWTQDSDFEKLPGVKYVPKKCYQWGRTDTTRQGPLKQR